MTRQSAWALGPYFLGVLAVGFLLTPLFNAARGSLLIAALYHFQMNGPAWPEAQPWENYLFALLAVAIVVLNRKAMLNRAGAPNEVLFPGDESQGPLNCREPKGSWGVSIRAGYSSYSSRRSWRAFSSAWVRR